MTTNPHIRLRRLGFTAPSAGLITISLTTLADESATYRPGYFEAALAARQQTESPPHVIVIDSSALQQIRRQHATGCCGH